MKISFCATGLVRNDEINRISTPSYVKYAWKGDDLEVYVCTCVLY